MKTVEDGTAPQEGHPRHCSLCKARWILEAYKRWTADLESVGDSPSDWFDLSEEAKEQFRKDLETPGFAVYAGHS